MILKQLHQLLVSIYNDKFITYWSASVLFNDAFGCSRYIALAIGQRVSRLHWWDDTDRRNRNSQRKICASAT
jgi:hypothetical protein